MDIVFDTESNINILNNFISSLYIKFRKNLDVHKTLSLDFVNGTTIKIEIDEDSVPISIEFKYLKAKQIKHKKNNSDFLISSLFFKSFLLVSHREYLSMFWDDILHEMVLYCTMNSKELLGVA